MTWHSFTFKGIGPMCGLAWQLTWWRFSFLGGGLQSLLWRISIQPIQTALRVETNLRKGYHAMLPAGSRVGNNGTFGNQTTVIPTKK
jgi:hypothetical protein